MDTVDKKLSNENFVIKKEKGKWRFNGLPYYKLNEVEKLIFSKRMLRGKLATKKTKKNKSDIDIFLLAILVVLIFLAILYVFCFLYLK
jgi:hypothetical protein